MDAVVQYALAYALTTSAGVRALLPLAAASFAAHAGWIHPPGEFAWLGHGAVMWVLIAFAVLEMAADKIPLVDHAMHFLHVAAKPAAAAGATSFDGLFRDFGAGLAASAGGLPPQPPYAFASVQFGHTYQNVQTNDSTAATVTVPPVGVAGTTTFDANQPFGIYPGGVTVLAIANPVSKQQLYVTDSAKTLGIAGAIVSK